MCGDNLAWLFNLQDRWGIPPRVRGLHNLYVTCHCSDRNTPVCTGTVAEKVLSPTRRTEYPRLYGDCLANGIEMGFPYGIPPSVRGLYAQHHPLGHVCRNTPVCAGTAYPEFPLELADREYPRVYGDNSGTDPKERWLAGIPPRARGDNRVILPTKSAPNGILPLVRGLPLMTSRCYWEIGGVR